jgi:type VI protein secretion system component Hcp
MPQDIYVRFGQEDDSDDSAPVIEGDCTDDRHTDWCELRDTGFSIDNPDKEKTGDDATKDEKKQTLNFGPVTLKKRVDWASTQLILKCIQASKAKIQKDEELGTIDDVTVEICKRAGGASSIPFVIIKYKKVRITEYQLDMSDPEPSESITFEYDKMLYGFQQTSPTTGEPIGQIIWTGGLEATKAAPASSSQGSSTAETTSNGSPAAGAAAAGGAAAAAAAAGGAAVQTSASSAPGAENGSGNSLASAADLAIANNFPGLWGPDGFGALPD